MAKEILRETQYISQEAPKSKILGSSFVNRLNSLFGYRVSKEAKSDFEKKYGFEFVKVDLANPAYRVKSAALGSIFESQNLTKSLERYFDEYLKETSLSYADIQERQVRLNELSFMNYNDPFISRCVKLVADEATQIDVQNRILSVESPNIAFSQKCYELFSIWGITPSRIHAACYDLQLYGEAFWGHKVTLRGVENIKPIGVNVIKERLEFNPQKMAEFLAQRDGFMKTNKNRLSKLQTLIQNYKDGTAIDYGENLADMFDSKLLGFELEDGLIAPPWTITHFRVDSDHSEFHPYGRSPLLHCLAPFKQSYSTIALQGLARSMSFPVTLYKVKTVEGISPGKAFELVNNVREEYDNIGLTPASAGSEVYTVNTKIWLAESLMDVEIKEAKADIDFVGDLEIYQDRVAIAAGVPKSYLDQEFGGFGNSGIALTEQYKPFARHVYTIQTAFLEGLGMLIRLHFAITGEFDYNTPFVLSMRFPASEYGDEQREARQASIELSQSIMELITSALGIEEGEPLPEDVIVDVLSKYTFLDATDIQKWVRLSSFLKPLNLDDAEEEGGDGMDDSIGDDMGGDMGGDDMGGDEGGDDMGGDMPESSKSRDVKRLLRERKLYLRKLKEERLRELNTRYKNAKGEIYIRFLESNGLSEFCSGDSFGKHAMLIPKINEHHLLHDSIKVLKDEPFDDNLKRGYEKLNEGSVEEMMERKRNETKNFDVLENQVKRVLRRKADED